MRFRHVCAPCDDCGSTGRELCAWCGGAGCSSCGEQGVIDEACTTCDGQSRACRCEDAWADEGDRRYKELREREL